MTKCSFDVQSDAVWELACFPDGKLLAIAEQRGSVTFWNIETGQQRGALPESPGFVGCHSLAISSDGKFLAAGLLPPIEHPEQSIVQVWEIAVVGKENPLVATYEVTKFNGHSGLVGALAFSPDGKVMASGGSDTTVRIWSSSTGEALASLKSHMGVIDGVEFSPDGKHLTTASWDRHVHLWEVDDVVKRKEHSTDR